MAFIRDEILKAWDKAVARVAHNHEDLTDDELEGVVAAVCSKLPGVTRDDITAALRSVEELQGEVAAADRVLKFLEAKVRERDGKLPGLPGGPPLKH